MQLFDTIYRWVKSFGSEWVETAPYEELFRRYGDADSDGKRMIFAELCRRLSRLVYRATQDYVGRRKGNVSESEVTELKDKIFRSFAPEMDAGKPEFGLRRLATRIRSELDDEAFYYIARAFYYQLPIYHLPNDEQRRILAALLQEELYKREGVSYVEQVAQDFRISQRRAAAIIKSGNKRLNQVIENDFEEDELRRLTEGYLPQR